MCICEYVYLRIMCPSLLRAPGGSIWGPQLCSIRTVFTYMHTSTYHFYMSTYILNIQKKYLVLEQHETSQIHYPCLIITGSFALNECNFSQRLNQDPKKQQILFSFIWQPSKGDADFNVANAAKLAKFYSKDLTVDDFSEETLHMTM